VGSVDALNSGAAVGVIAIVGMAAACLPARRVLRVLPAQVLRS
jgi:ABC-type antimicrobial peptide transport system permease subunit